MFQRGAAGTIQDTRKARRIGRMFGMSDNKKGRTATNRAIKLELKILDYN